MGRQAVLVGVLIIASYLSLSKEAKSQEAVEREQRTHRFTHVTIKELERVSPDPLGRVLAY